MQLLVGTPSSAPCYTIRKRGRNVLVQLQCISNAALADRPRSGAKLCSVVYSGTPTPTGRKEFPRQIFFELRHPVEWRSIDGVEQTASSVALTLRSLTILCRVQNILVAKGFAFPAKTPTPNNTSITALPLSTTSSYQKHCGLRCISTDRGRAMLCQAAR